MYIEVESIPQERIVQIWNFSLAVPRPSGADPSTEAVPKAMQLLNPMDNTTFLMVVKLFCHTTCIGDPTSLSAVDCSVCDRLGQHRKVYFNESGTSAASKGQWRTNHLSLVGWPTYQGFTNWPEPVASTTKRKRGKSVGRYSAQPAVFKH